MSEYSTEVVFDTSIATHNVGDEIIMKGVDLALEQTFGTSRIVRVTSHEKLGRASLSLIRHARNAVVGGSNILSSYMNRYPQWKISLLDSVLIKHKVVLLGVGWRQYQKNTNWYTRTLLKNLLHPARLHSVRDSYTAKKLQAIGLDNVINTGCPTTWMLTEAHCKTIPRYKARSVVFTLTDYDKDRERDSELIKILRKNYEEIYYWVQGKRDFEYLRSLGQENGINIIAPNLFSYDNFLDEKECDYVGTRLHGGIRALQKRRRSIILGIDNRATEKKQDFNLPVLDRKEISQLDTMINAPLDTSIRLPLENIARWKNQFANEDR